MTNLRIDPRDSSRAEVIVDIDASTPISEQTVAELQLQGVTGLLYIDLGEDRSGKRASAPVASLRYPVIRSAPSRFDVFLEGLPELVAAVGNLINRADRLLSDENIAAVTAAVGNLDKASASLPRTVKDLNALLAELHGASAELAASARLAHGMLQTVDPEVRAAAQRMRAIAESLADASESAR